MDNMQSLSYTLPLWLARRPEVVGGKAANLSRLMAGDFPVPDGFVVTTHAFRLGVQQGLEKGIPLSVREAIVQAYHELGEPSVAVRSSATAEDLMGASMAGQYETFLDCQGTEEVCDAIHRCWLSVYQERVQSYLREHHIPLSQVAMAVVVQKLVPAKTAGVLFTVNPQTGDETEMLIEASWGLGESVVSGTVQPDSIRIDAQTGTVKEARISRKMFRIVPNCPEPQPIPEVEQFQLSLSPFSIQQLWQLGKKIAQYFQTPQDIEWAITADQTLYILQSRPITTLASIQIKKQVREKSILFVREGKRNNKGPWVKHNLAETLPHPTPLTWEVLQKFMSGKGGWGEMYRQVGFQPSEAINDTGFLDLIGGTIYVDLSRASEIFFPNFPFRYDIDVLKANPGAAQGPPTIPTGSAWEQWKVTRQLRQIQRKITQWSDTFIAEFEQQLIPQLLEYVTQEKARDLATLTVPEWIQLWNDRENKVLHEFGCKLFLPNLFIGHWLEELKSFLQEYLWAEASDQLIQSLSTSPKADLTLLANADLWRVAQGEFSPAEWIQQYGHRAPNEFDLITPRWYERPEELLSFASLLKNSEDPKVLHQRRWERTQKMIQQLTSRLKGKLQSKFQKILYTYHQYLPYRENGKFYFIYAYQLLRDMVREAGRRLQIGDDVCFLTLSELIQALHTQYLPLGILEKRKAEYQAYNELAIQDVIIDEKDLFVEDIPCNCTDSVVNGISISPGISQGPVKIIHAPEEGKGLSPGYILLCHSTDPNWTPLFVNAHGVILECGGVLSHGAVVAREMGIPAIVIPQAKKLFEDGEMVTINTEKGYVIRQKLVEEKKSELSACKKDQDQEVPTLPPMGLSEQKSISTFLLGTLSWTIFLLLIYWVLPKQWVLNPIYHLLDLIFLPLLSSMGRPFTVSMVASLIGTIYMVTHYWVIDIHRLREIKKRIALWRQQIKTIPENSPKKKELMAVISQGQRRITQSSLVPLGILLGPFILSFMWCASRIDPTNKNPRPGSFLNLIVKVADTTYQKVQLELPPGFNVDPATPLSQNLKPYRSILQQHLEWCKNHPPQLEGYHWSQKLVYDQVYNDYIQRLSSFLKNGTLPPQTLSWRIYTPPQEGLWTLSVLLPEVNQKLEVPIALGDSVPPQTRTMVEVEGPRGTKQNKWVQQILASNPQAILLEAQVTTTEERIKTETSFWKPLKWLEPHPDEDPRWYHLLFAPWIVLYLIVYLSTFIILKMLMRIP